MKKNIITELKYSNTNTYLIEGCAGTVLFDTGWAGTFSAFCKALGDNKKRIQDINYILISHFHPDHMGIAQEIADYGPVIVITGFQKNYVHSSDDIFAKDSKIRFEPVIDDNLKIISVTNSRAFLKRVGINGELIDTPGHSDDSISLLLDEGFLFVGDLNPLYELELHKGTQIEESWNKLLSYKPNKIFYGHAKPAVLNEESTALYDESDMYKLVSQIMRYIDRGFSLEKIKKKTGADSVFIEDVNRMYLTHQDVGVQGILDRIEIKNR